MSVLDKTPLKVTRCFEVYTDLFASVIIGDLDTMAKDDDDKFRGKRNNLVLLFKFLRSET